MTWKIFQNFFFIVVTPRSVKITECQLLTINNKNLDILQIILEYDSKLQVSLVNFTVEDLKSKKEEKLAVFSERLTYE